MSSASNRTLVLAFYQRVVAEGRLEEIPHFVGTSYVDHNAPADAPSGPAVLEAHLRAIRTTFPDFTLRTHECIAEGDWVAVRVTGEGTHMGEWMGIKPSGKRVRLRGLNFDRLSDGRIVEHWGEADTIGMLVQMGLDPFKGKRPVWARSLGG